MLFLLACAARHPGVVEPVVTADLLVGSWTAVGPESMRLTFTQVGDELRATSGGITGEPPVEAPVYLGAPPLASFPLRPEIWVTVHPIGPDLLRAEFTGGLSPSVSGLFTRYTPAAEAARAAARAAEEEARRVTAAANEVPDNLAGIRMAEIGYDAAFDRFLGCGPLPRAVDALTPDAVAWEPDASTCFYQIGWRPDAPTRGAYSVEVAADGHNFLAHAWEDADGDGVPAHWTTTVDQAVVRVTPEGVR